MAQEEDFSKLSIEDKVNHKVPDIIPLACWFVDDSDDARTLRGRGGKYCFTQLQVWKARVMGYEEAIKHFKKQDDENSPEYNVYAGLLKKFVVDSNAVAQEKGVDATLAFLENAAPSIGGRYVTRLTVICRVAHAVIWRTNDVTALPCAGL